MAKYLITWNSGYGEESDLFEADSEEEASDEACRRWREAAENQAEYEARLVTEENAEELADEYGIEWEDE